jgi:hypothetical protein
MTQKGKLVKILEHYLEDLEKLINDDKRKRTEDLSTLE